MARMVNCVKIGRELPGLDAPPFPGELGQRIYDQVSARAFEMWPAQATILINHYGLNLADPAARQFLLEQMDSFFFSPGARMPEGWVPPGQSGKGAPAPPAKK